MSKNPLSGAVPATRARQCSGCGKRYPTQSFARFPGKCFAQWRVDLCSACWLNWLDKHAPKPHERILP